MVVTKYTDKDYTTVCGWWLARGWPVAPKHCLSTTGLIVPEVCAGWIYKSDSSIAWMEWIISNPNTESTKRAEALDVLIDALVAQAKDGGFKHIFSSISHPSLMARYEKHGFQATDKNMTNYMRTL